MGILLQKQKLALNGEAHSGFIVLNIGVCVRSHLESTFSGELTNTIHEVSYVIHVSKTDADTQPCEPKAQMLVIFRP